MRPFSERYLNYNVSTLLLSLRAVDGRIEAKGRRTAADGKAEKTTKNARPQVAGRR